MPLRPITVLTGFLGAGKTTLLSRVLADPAFADTAVVINEFGDVALDHALIAEADESLIETTAGCLCCAVQGDVRDVLVRLVEKAERGEIRPFQRMVVETTGLAEPARALQTLISEPRLVGRAALSRVVAVVDGVGGAAALEDYAEARAQVAAADLLIVSKLDQVADAAERAEASADIRARLSALNPTVDILDGAPTPTDLFEPAVRDWSAPIVAPTRHAHSHSVATHSWTFEEPLDAPAFWSGLARLLAEIGPRLLRLKGLVGLDDAPERPWALHGVRHVMSPPTRLERWPAAAGDRTSRIVVITDGVEPEALARAGRGFDAAANSPEAAAQRLLRRPVAAP